MPLHADNGPSPSAESAEGVLLLMVDLGLSTTQLQPRGEVLQALDVVRTPVMTCCVPLESAVPVQGPMVEVGATRVPVMDGVNFRFLLPRCVSSPLSLNLTRKPVVVVVEAACE